MKVEEMLKVTAGMANEMNKLVVKFENEKKELHEMVHQRDEEIERLRSELEMQKRENTLLKAQLNKRGVSGRSSDGTVSQQAWTTSVAVPKSDSSRSSGGPVTPSETKAEEISVDI